MGATQQLQLPLASSSSSSSSILPYRYHCHTTTTSLPFNRNTTTTNNHRTIITHSLSLNHVNHRRSIQLARVSMDDSAPEIPAASTATAFEENDLESEPEPEPTPEDLEYISQIKRVLELLRRNRDMLFGEVKLTIMIEDPREIERRRLLGLDDSDGPTREDLVAVLEEVNDGKIPRDRVALRMLAEEMNSWPNLEAEPSKKTTKNKSLYAKVTDTGIDPAIAARKLNVDWDSAAEIETAENSDDTDVPPAVGS